MDALPSLPCCIRTANEGYRWTKVKYGNSGADVYRLDPQDDEENRDRPPLYLKFGTEAVAQEIIAEATRLEWLRHSLPVPEIHHFCYSAGHAWLLTQALSGRNAYDFLVVDPDGRAAIVEALAHFLLQVHSLPVKACPFNSDHQLRLIEARRNIDTARFSKTTSSWYMKGGLANRSGKSFRPSCRSRLIA